MLTTQSFFAFIFLLIVLMVSVFLGFRKKQIYKFKQRLFAKNQKESKTLLIYCVIIIVLIASFFFSVLLPSNSTDDRAIDFAESELKSTLKYPDSLSINSITIKDSYNRDDYSCYYIVIDYSAQNGFGGYNRKVSEMYIKLPKDSSSAQQISQIDFYYYMTN